MQVRPGSDGRPRCEWALMTPQMQAYHDTEWGFPEGDDVRLFEKLCLEAFQSGLSWRTILQKRDGFRAAFAGFDPAMVARFDHDDVDRLLQDQGIVRNRAKIEAVIHNAGRFSDTIGDGTLADLVWKHEPERRVPERLVATSPESVALAKELKSHGWKFVGPTTAYAFMQAMGLVNDHLDGCVIRDAVEDARSRFTAPGP